MGLYMLTGEYNITLDEMGRIALPRKMRDGLKENYIILSKGADHCLWLYTPDYWKQQADDIVNNTDEFSDYGRLMRQIFIGTSQECDIDKQGRILIPPSLRSKVGLSRDCVLLGQVHYFEIWADDHYKAHLDASRENYKTGLKELSSLRMKKKDLGNGGNRSFSGAAGANAGVSGTEEQP